MRWPVLMLLFTLVVVAVVLAAIAAGFDVLQGIGGILLGTLGVLLVLVLIVGVAIGVRRLLMDPDRPRSGRFN